MLFQLVELLLHIGHKADIRGALLRSLQPGRIRLQAQIELILRRLEPIPLHGRKLELFDGRGRAAYDLHIPGQRCRQPGECGDNVAIQRVQQMQIIDEQKQHVVVHVLDATQQILKPVVNVQRIEGRILGQIALGYVEYN